MKQGVVRRCIEGVKDQDEVQVLAHQRIAAHTLVEAYMLPIGPCLFEWFYPGCGDVCYVWGVCMLRAWYALLYYFMH